MNHILDQVKFFAEKAHGMQKRKFSEEPYIFHLIRVANTCSEYTDDIAVLSAAFLHDVLEDTQVTRDQILEFLETIMDSEKAMKTVSLVIELTDVYIKKDFPGLNREKRKVREAERLASASEDAQTIKYADVIDNSTDIAKYNTDFSEVYLKEAIQLLHQINKGNPVLYRKAVSTTEHCYKLVNTEGR